jgi:hypothetical protein
VTATTLRVAVVLWALVMVLAPMNAPAQALDAGLPDASVGQGGADQTSEENDPNAAPCLDSKSCDNGFSCIAGRCVPGPRRNATGCAAAPAGALLAALVVGRGRRRSGR